MLPPVLEIYAVWHPEDDSGAEVVEQLIDHFHGTSFSGLIGGAVEVYGRSESYRDPQGPPRPLPCVEALPYELPGPAITAVVPILSTPLALAVERDEGGWFRYLTELIEAHEAAKDSVGIFPLLVDEGAADGTRLGTLLGSFQRIDAPDIELAADNHADRRCRDLAQGIAQLASGRTEQLTVFISHTKHRKGAEGLPEQVEQVRDVFQHTRLKEYFDATDLEPGREWSEELEQHAATAALLGVRTDLYSLREWCQREMAIAKRAGMPVVILDALESGEERGSFLMDHVPRVPSNGQGSPSSEAGILRALNELVDECLKRELWTLQRGLAEEGEEDPLVAWWAPHAPEPLTFVHWLTQARGNRALDESKALRVLHPDPPLGLDELKVLEEIVLVAGVTAELEVLTPRGLAARGG